MILPSLNSATLDKLVTWGNIEPSIRGMILTSSLTRPDGPVDVLTDYDVIFAVTDAERYGQDDAWVSSYGTPMVRYYDQDTLYGLTTYSRCVLYEDYVKIDYTVWPVDLLKEISAQANLPDELDAGYRVLLDKDAEMSGWMPPTYRGYIPARPTEAQYQALIEEFWFSSTYVAKSLWRDELVFARWVFDQEMRNDLLRRLLEWRIEIDHDWSIRPGVNGRGMKPWLPEEFWTALESTYVGPEIDANWGAFWRAIALFRRVAKEVGAALGYAYLQALDDKVSAYLHAVQIWSAAALHCDRKADMAYLEPRD